jgi:hypothetical protein
MTTLPSTSARRTKKGEAAPRNIAIVLAFLWLFGLLASFTLGGWIHLLLAAAVAVFAFDVIRTANRRGSR